MYGLDHRGDIARADVMHPTLGPEAEHAADDEAQSGRLVSEVGVERPEHASLVHADDRRSPSLQVTGDLL